MKKRFLNIDNIISLLLIILAIPSFIFTILQWLGYQPPSKPINVFERVYAIIIYRIPIAWAILFVCIAVIAVRAIYYRKYKNYRRNILTSSDLESIVQNEVDIDLRSIGQQINFCFQRATGIPQLTIWIKVINKSSMEVVLDKVKWELWIGQPVKNDTTAFGITIKPKETKDDILIKTNLSDSESSYIKSIKSMVSIRSFSGDAFFVLDGETIKKKFRLENINYSIEKNKNDLPPVKEKAGSTNIFFFESNAFWKVDGPSKIFDRNPLCICCTQHNYLSKKIKSALEMMGGIFEPPPEEEYFCVKTGKKHLLHPYAYIYAYQVARKKYGVEDTEIEKEIEKINEQRNAKKNNK